MPSSSRDFQKAALQRLTVAEFLLLNRYTLDAMYLIGYAVECSLEALILEVTPVADRPSALARITAGRKWHSFEVLAGVLKDLGRPVPPR